MSKPSEKDWGRLIAGGIFFIFIAALWGDTEYEFRTREPGELLSYSGTASFHKQPATAKRSESVSLVLQSSSAPEMQFSCGRTRSWGAADCKTLPMQVLNGKEVSVRYADVRVLFILHSFELYELEFNGNRLMDYEYSAQNVDVTIWFVRCFCLVWLLWSADLIRRGWVRP